MSGALTWRWCRFDELSVYELQAIYMARQQVFSIEQACAYLDADGFDEASFHLAAWSAGHKVPLAYARVLQPGQKYGEREVGCGKEGHRPGARNGEQSHEAYGIRDSR